MQFALNEDQIAVRDMAREFAAEKIAPHAVRWDEEKHFPVDVMREAATLGMGGIYIRDDVGGSGADAVRRGADLRGAGERLPDRLGLHLHPQHGVVDDRRLRQRRAAPAMAAETLHHGAAGELLPDRARRRLRCGSAEHPRGARRRSLRAQRPEAVHLRRRRRRSLCRDGAHRRRRARRHFDAGDRGQHARPVASAPTSARWAGTRSRPAR